MSDDNSTALIDSYWGQAAEAMAGLSGDQHARFTTAVGAVDTVWDRHVFDQAEIFGGPEIGYARALSGSILARLLGLDSAVLVSVAGGEIPPTGNEVLDEGLVRWNLFVFLFPQGIVALENTRHQVRKAVFPVAWGHGDQVFSTTKR